MLNLYMEGELSDEERYAKVVKIWEEATNVLTDKLEHGFDAYNETYVDMIEAGIMDGDYILVEQQNTARNGDIVVAMIDGFESEATVKTFYRENGYIRLQPENSSMSPIIVKDVKILGKVKGVFRYFS